MLRCMFAWNGYLFLPTAEATPGGVVSPARLLRTSAVHPDRQWPYEFPYEIVAWTSRATIRGTGTLEATGNRTRNVVPAPGVEENSTEPPCSPISRRVTNRPRPVPCCLVVK